MNCTLNVNVVNELKKFHVNFLGTINLYKNLHEKYSVHETLMFHILEPMNILWNSV